MLVKVKYLNQRKYVHLDMTTDSVEAFIARVRNKFMAELGNEKIIFRDLDDTEIDHEDLLEYILEKQSNSFILHISKKSSVATGLLSTACSTAVIDLLSASTIELLRKY